MNHRVYFLLLIGLACPAVVVLALVYGAPHRRCVGMPRNSCIANLKQLDGAKQTWALESGITNHSVMVRMSQLCGATNYIRDEPTCPMGGTYSLRRICDKPACSVPGHTL